MKMLYYWQHDVILFCPGAAQVGVGHFAHAGAKSRASACHCQRCGLRSMGALAEKTHGSAGWGSQLGNHMVSDSRDQGRKMDTTYQGGSRGHLQSILSDHVTPFTPLTTTS